MTTGRSLDPKISALVGRVTEIVPVLLANGGEGEVSRRIPEGSLAALVESGVFRTSVPTRFGGYAGSSRAGIAVAREIGRGDGGAAWVFGIYDSGSWVTAMLPLRAQEEVWGESPDTLVSIVLATTSQAVKVEGGYRVTGQWNYGTGSAHAAWSLLGVPLEDEQGNVIDGGLALIPTSDLSSEETWFVAGMKSTGSNTQVADDVFVPDHRILPLTPALEGEYPGKEVNPELAYKTPFVPSLVLKLVGPHLGMGRAVLDLVIAKASTKGIAYTNYERQSDSVAFQMAVARAALLLETAELFLGDLADRLEAEAEAGVYRSFAERIHVRAGVGWAVEAVTQEIDTLLSAHGSGAFADVNAIQRFWRDQATAARHAHSLPSTGYEVYGKVLLGLVDEARAVLPAV
jgi:3-hydroxy-9,10-secoandrosta-1,3,5(10)-triene-9,17-dione monooxygenase